MYHAITMSPGFNCGVYQASVTRSARARISDALQEIVCVSLAPKGPKVGALRYSYISVSTFISVMSYPRFHAALADTTQINTTASTPLYS